MDITDSERLSFHFITDSDVDFLWELDQDADVMRFISGGQKTSRSDIESIFLPRLQAYSNPALGWGLWKVNERASNSSIGWILVRPFGFFSTEPDIDNIELGWRFQRDSWGHGYATEAALHVKEALYLMGVEKFSAITTKDNQNSINVMKKLGMTFSHELEHNENEHSETLLVYTT